MPADYPRLIQQIRQIVQFVMPSDATAVVVSRGDEELISLEGRRGWHFPQSSGGAYAGHHLADSRAAIDHLEELRCRAQAI